MRPWKAILISAIALLMAVSVEVLRADGIVMTPERVRELVPDPWTWIAEVYNATPTVTPPATLTGVAYGADFTVSPDGPFVVSVDGKLLYRVTLGPWSFPGAVPHLDPWRLLEAGAIGVAVGVAGTLLALALTGHLR